MNPLTTAPDPDWRLAVVLLVLVVVAASISRLADLGVEREHVTAAARAVLQLIGGAMTASTLTGRRAFDELSAHRGSYEAALALGFPAPAAAHLVVQPTAREALTPGLDQTRTVGLVTLPGAFVGVLLGGGTALEAGAAQVLVLIGLLTAQAITSASTLRLIATGRVVRRDLCSVFPR